MNRCDGIDLNNPEFIQAYELLKNTRANVFLTGKAGTGKSTFLRYICKHINKEYVVLAPTGIAAVNVGGVTIHSFFQMPLRPVPPDDPEYSVSAFMKSRKFSKRKRKLMQELELIVIDEVSMVRPDMIDFIDRALRGVRSKRGIPFGGVQLLLVGDIFQLEPVVTSDARMILSKYYSDFFFFNALAYNQVKLLSVELIKIYRQTDSSFIELLDRIRLNRVVSGDFDLLNSKVNSSDLFIRENDENSKFAITLATRRDVVEMINKERMDNIDAPEILFQGEIEDEFPEKILPTQLSLSLKQGAQVMMIRNDRDRRWVNGTLARIKELSDNEIVVELENGRTEKVDKETWENITYTYDDKEKKIREEVIGRFVQYPLKAAWALTIHKSQGLTFNRVIIDMEGGAFSAGQTYVALSRCTSLDGITFINPIRKGDVMVSRGASRFSQTFNDKALIDRTINEYRASALASEAICDFEDDDYSGAIEKLWDINSLVDVLNRKSVRRLLSRHLSKIYHLKEQLKERDAMLRNISKEFMERGDQVLENGESIEVAYCNYAKAVDINPENKKAFLGMARCKKLLGDFKTALTLLDKVAAEGGDCSFDALICKGDILAEKGDLSRAALNYMSAHKKSQDSRLPLDRLVKLYEDANLEEMADKYREVLRKLSY